jgi:hypothetical protein
VSSTTITDVRVYSNWATINSFSTYIWGAQLEALPYATSYIPTVASTVTRVADVVSKSSISSLLNSEEGTLFYEFNPNGILAVNKFICLNNATNYLNGSLQLYQTTVNTMRLRYDVGGVNQADIISPLSYTSGTIKVAGVYKLNRFELWVNGVKVGQDTSGSVNTAGTFTKLEFSRDGLLPFYGKLKNLQVYSTALSDEQLISLTQ